MSDKIWKLYLSGEIHTNCRDEIKDLCIQKKLPVIINFPNTIHEDSDDCGGKILGNESDKFWHDHKGASINSIRNSTLIKNTDIIVNDGFIKKSPSAIINLNKEIPSIIRR